MYGLSIDISKYSETNSSNLDLLIDKKLSSVKYIKSIDKIKEIDVAFIIIDAEKGMDGQDKRIINIVTNKAKSIIIIYNKMDLIKKKAKYKKDTLKEIKYSLHQIKNVKFFFCCAFSKNHIKNILNYLLKNPFYQNYAIKTSKLNNWLKMAVSHQQHPLIENKKVNFFILLAHLI